MASNRLHASAPSQQTTLVKALISAANNHRLTALDSLFTRSAVLGVGTRHWRGRASLNSWWQGQFDHKVHITLSSAVDSTGAVAHFAMLRKTQGGDCPSGCWNGAQTRFSGGR